MSAYPIDIVRRALLLALVLAAGAQHLLAAERPESPDEAYLNALQGNWNMAGTVMGKAVKYHAHAERVLQGGFLRSHMIDASDAPTYEADVFLGFDPHARDYVSHWLDRFGAAGARVVATGKRMGSKLIITFPYAEAAFRDTFTRDEKSGTWALFIESQAKDGTWSTFANYTLVPEKTS